MSKEEKLRRRIVELEGKLKQKNTIRFKIGQKGGVSVYGLGRFPVTLYYEQWMRLLKSSDDLQDFLEENKKKLKLRGDQDEE